MRRSIALLFQLSVVRAAGTAPWDQELMTLLAAGTRLCRRYLLTPECFVLFCSLYALGFLFTRLWGSTESVPSIFPQGAGIGPVPVRPGALNFITSAERFVAWSESRAGVSIRSVQGFRAYMEDRYSVVENFNDSGVSLYAVYDGHGGEFTSEFAEHAVTQGVLQHVLRNHRATNLSTVIRDAILDADRRVTDLTREAKDISGSTALVALRQGTRLTVANVGDSRGVLCSMDNTPVLLSHDHKPAELSERQRIEAAGGFIQYNGVWRVAGILATSRALGDFPLKDKKYVIAEPDIRTFDLSEAKFFILASDGLWDVVSNEEACRFVSDRFDTQDRGAKELVEMALRKGSLDNITVLIVAATDTIAAKGL